MARNKGLAKAKRCLKLKQQGKVSAARLAGCSWPSRARARGRALGPRRRNRGLQGHVRTCVQYKCVKGRGAKNPEAACKKGWVLRCAEYAPEPGMPRTAATRKPYMEFTYGRYIRGKGARQLIPPNMNPSRLRPTEKRFKNVPRSAVQPGPGRK